jgi:hypothetical protein
MGDSAITETAGFGAFVLEGGEEEKEQTILVFLLLFSAPAFARGLPADMARLRAITAENGKLMAGSNPILLVATNDSKPLRAGLDVRKVTAHGIGPWIDTGITHKDAGHRVIGRGFVRAPIECFQLAQAAFEKKYGAKI